MRYGSGMSPFCALMMTHLDIVFKRELCIGLLLGPDRQLTNRYALDDTTGESNSALLHPAGAGSQHQRIDAFRRDIGLDHRKAFFAAKRIARLRNGTFVFVLAQILDFFGLDCFTDRTTLADIKCEFLFHR